jgi:hypothetical protein
MYKSEIEYASLRAVWKFNQMLPQLPVPATEPFAFLVKQLVPFGINSRSITIETPSYNLADVSFIIELINPRIRLKITYEEIEILSDNVEEEDVLNILKIMSIVFECLEKLDPETKKGLGETKVSLHLTFFDEKVEDYLFERISDKIQQATPEAIIFVLKDDATIDKFSTRITIANSSAFENALFLELSYQTQISSVEEPMAFFESLRTHYQNVFSLLDIELVEASN